MKNGIVKEDGKLIYYSNGVPSHAGAIKIDDDIYYVGRNGYVATGQHIVHGDMTNGLLKRGTYTFDENGKLIEGSFHPPKKITHTHRRTESKKDKRHNRKFRIKKRRFALLVSVVIAAVLLIGFAVYVDRLTSNSESSSEVSSEQNISLPDFDTPINLCTVPAQKLFSKEVTMADIKEADVYLPFEFNYRLTDTDGELLISENQNLSNPQKNILAKNKTSVSIHNLKTGTTYYYRVDIGKESFSGSFETAEGTRYIYIPGVYNTRDIGGYTTLNGNKIKQGMIIRGTEMDGLVDASYFLSHKDVESVQEQFGFVYDMDLREPWVHYGEYTSPLGENVGQKFYQAPAYVNVFSEPYKDVVKDIFTDLSNPQNYPMYLHDTNGADRTGTIVYLLQGLLGMADDELIREYQMSGLHKHEFATSERMEPVAEIIEDFRGNTTAEKIESFLIDEIGITKDQIDSIRDILLED